MKNLKTWLGVTLKVRIEKDKFTHEYRWFEPELHKQRFTIDIDGLSMVLVEVNSGSQKKAETQKKHDLLKKNTGINKL